MEVEKEMKAPDFMLIGEEEGGKKVVVGNRKVGRTSLLKLALQSIYPLLKVGTTVLYVHFLV